MVHQGHWSITKRLIYRPYLKSCLRLCDPSSFLFWTSVFGKIRSLSRTGVFEQLSDGSMPTAIHTHNLWPSKLKWLCVTLQQAAKKQLVIPSLSWWIGDPERNVTERFLLLLGDDIRTESYQLDCWSEILPFAENKICLWENKVSQLFFLIHLVF